MTADQLGRRYERLLFFSGPLTMVAVLILLVSFTSTNQKERIQAKCLKVAINAISGNEKQLSDKWDEYQKDKSKSKFAVNNYGFELKRVWISPGIESGCYKDIEPLLEQGADNPPSKLVEDFAARENKLKNIPLQFRGIEIPQKTEGNVFGTNIKASLESFTAVLQVSLAPILMIWLGSIYNTRFRETLLIGKSNEISSLFPHLINVYPSIDLPTLRRRSRIAYWLPPSTIISIIYAIPRLILVLFIIAPSITCYLVSLYILPIEGIEWLSFIWGLLVGVFFLSVLLVEILPWHALKIFPGILKK